ncbi:transcriptional regulator PtsJ [Entomohabitans teleogrylli]|uniref:MocR-like B6 salvage transcription factor PtsJ n=1 Tax=Entomohabitans teleogrylli TaxID=1384589 RepID=UPI00073D1D68|nr:transcriptional regulator PtsJ [Entomohabitans teleogrylli]
MIIGHTASEIFDSIRSLVRRGELLPGASLPPVRALAMTLGVNRNTVAAAYRRLVGAGIAHSQGRAGTFIRQPENLAEREGSLSGSVLIDVSGGNPDPQLLPDLRHALAQCSLTPGLYGEPVIHPRLERAARNWMSEDVEHPFSLSLSHGSVDAVERLLASYLVPGDRVGVEDPCFLSSINTLRHNGYQPCAIAVDEHGMEPRALRAALESGIEAVIITPRAHNPCGVSLTPQRAAALRRCLAGYPQVMVIVDDHFSLLSTHPFCQVIAPQSQRWALVRSVAKIFGPDLRLACIASDEVTAQRLGLRLAPGTNWVSHLIQELAGVLLSSAQQRTRLAQVRECYRQRRSLLADALRERGVALQHEHDGLNIWIPLPGGSQRAVLEMAHLGWSVRGGEGFAVGNASDGLRVTVAALDERQILRLAGDLAQVLSHNLSG